ncbi:MAG: DUF4465 domain-containing protein [Bacteroidetes bacterium]|nr:DUF4465 domain-containing protein [Bacteroidota bacterium]
MLHHYTSQKPVRLAALAALGLWLTFSSASFAQGPFPPAAGQPGSTAIHKDDPAFKAWANGYEIVRGWVNIADTSVYAGGSNRASFGHPSQALGPASGVSTEVVSLGDGGHITLSFSHPIVNGPGFDFAVFENSFSDTFLELAFVEVSSDGQRFVRFPATSLTPTNAQVGSFGTLDPTNIHNLAGKYRGGYGTPFDLSDLADSTGIDLNNIRFVRIVDVVGSIDPAFATYDAQGNIVNDPFPTPFASGGFDLDGVGLINIGLPYRISHFDDLNLAPDSYWNGSDGSGGFLSGSAFFVNTYDPNWFSWSGWAYSNMRDDTTAGWSNQHSAITAGGMGAGPDGGTNYALAYVSSDFMGNNDPIPVQVNFAGDSLFIANGLYVTNTTMAYLSMRDGDAFAKKFGGPGGNDPDFFVLNAFGIRQDGSHTDTLQFYLADYRFDDNSLDYIVNDWRWFDLSQLGPVKGLRFFLLSSDVGIYGINTPTYLAADNLSLALPASPVALPERPSARFAVWPNPFSDYINISGLAVRQVQLFDLSGRMHLELNGPVNGTIGTSALKPGAYVMRIVHQAGIETIRLLKK